MRTRIAFYLLTVLTLSSFNNSDQQRQKTIPMATKDFTTTILVDQSPEQAFNAITNPRAWWSEEIVGGTSKLNDVFDYHFEDVHRCKIKLVEVIPNKKVVWLVLENYFKFTEDKTEWVGTQCIFDISSTDGKTEVRLTHEGLVPAYECFEICRDAWTGYIQKSLKDLITTGKGKPNAKGRPQTENEKKLSAKDYTLNFTVDASPLEAYNAINNIAKWWTDNLQGSSKKPGDEFTVSFFDEIHVSTQKVVEMIPGKKIVWHVTDSRLNFISDKNEWTGTRIIFDIAPKGNKTEIRFTHEGLAPGIECYKDCSNAWGGYLTGSLANLVNTGKGQPTLKGETLIKQ